MIPNSIGTSYWEYTYDKRGNLTGSDKYTRTTEGMKWQNVANYVYDETNRMVEGRNEQGEYSLYTYNGLGVRVGRELIMKDNTHGYTDFHDLTPSVSTDIDKPEVVKESYVVDYTTATRETLTMHEEGGFDYRWVHGLDRLSVKITSEGTNWWGQNVKQDILKDYTHQDRMGSTTNMTDKFGRIVGRADYNEWGEITYKEALSITSAYRRIYPEANYTGHDWDDVLGMYYAKARFYDPAAKRFVAMDPVKGNVVDPLSLVSYLYCEDNPLKYVDPMGLMNYWTQTDDLLLGVGKGIYNSTIGAAFNIPQTVDFLVQLVKEVVGGNININELLSVLFENSIQDYRTFINNIDTLDPSTTKTDEEVFAYGQAMGSIAVDIVGAVVTAVALIDKVVDFLKTTKASNKMFEVLDNLSDAASDANKLSHLDDVNDLRHLDDLGNGKGSSVGNGGSVDAGNGKGYNSVDANNTGKSYFDNSGNCQNNQAQDIDNLKAAVEQIQKTTVAETIGGKLLATFNQKWAELLSKCTFRNNTKGSTKLYVRNSSSGKSTALSDFYNLGLSEIEPKSTSLGRGYETLTGKTADGTVVNLHYSYSEHMWAIQYKNVKIRYPG